MLDGLNKQEKIDRKKLQSYLPELKKHYPDLGLQDEHSKALQHEVYRLFFNLKGLSKLKKNGKKVGRLRFKGKNRFKSFTYNQSGFDIIKTGNRLDMLHLSKIGDIPIRIHREIEGTIKQITVKQYASGKWFAFVVIEHTSAAYWFNRCVPLNAIDKSVGLDVGLTDFLSDSNKCIVDNLHALKKMMKKLRRAQRRLSRTKKQSKNREKQRIRVACLYGQIVDKRNDFLHKLSRYYVNAYDLICCEDLDIKQMISSVENDPKLTRRQRKQRRQAIHDVAWASFFAMLSYKAESAGKIFMQVDPRGTTQECSKCHHCIEMSLWERTYKCPNCGLVLPRDYNSSLVIKQRGIAKFLSENQYYQIGQGLSEFTHVDIGPLLKSSISASSMNEAGSYFQNL